MKRFSILPLLLLVLCAAPEQGLFARTVKIDTPNTSTVLDAKKGKKLKHLYYGKYIGDKDLESLMPALGKGVNAYPDYGLITIPETAIAVRHSDGDRTLDLVVDTVIPSVDGITTIRLRDAVYPFFVNVNYRTYPGEDMVETWTEILNKEEAPVTLTRFSSGYLPVRYGDVWVSHFYGDHKNEGRLVEEPLRPGMLVIKDRDGVRNSHYSHGEVMLSLDGKPQENAGRVIGAALCYSGNYKLRIDTETGNLHHFFAGINEEDSEYRLQPGDTFTTPVLALTYSSEGLGGVSRNFHKWGRNHRLANADKDRKVLLNSWEGVYFDVNEKGMESMMADIASMGGELFVMDDGWFGTKFPRDNSKAGLGDWKVNPKKLPHGIRGLIKAAAKNGIDFGIWIEPEMVNRNSELYAQHPDWVLKSPRREPVYGRGGNQMVLDMANPDVQQHVFNIVDTLMTNYPEIKYIKWDANMSILNHGSQYLGPDEQSHLFIEYHRGLENTLRRIRAKYPDVTIQACAAGGGRTNWGVLPYFDEFWVSDNTDALQRIFIQWGLSYFYPAIGMASHISASPNHQTQRIVPLKYRIDVAMSGRLGMEIQPKNMTDAEKALCRNAIGEYKKYIRPVVQHGDMYRLLSPYDDKGVASMMFVDGKKENAVFFWWKTRAFACDRLPRVAMSGLDPDARYRVRELNVVDKKPLAFENCTFSGAFLMENGLEIPISWNVDKDKRTDLSSRVLYLEKID